MTHQAIDGLRRLAALGATDGDPNVRAVAASILAFIDSDEGHSLDAALGIAPAAREAHWKTQRARRLRDLHFKAAASAFCAGLSPRSAANTIHTALIRYVDQHWPDDRHRSTCPVAHRGRIEAHLFHAMRAWPTVITRRRIEEIIADRSERVSSPNECRSGKL